MDAPFCPFEPQWDRPQLDAGELRRRSSFEWWYFDLQTAGDVSLVVVFSRRNPVLSRTKCSLYVEYHEGGRRLQRVRNYPSSSFAWTEGEPAQLRVGPNTLSLTTDAGVVRYGLELRTPDIEASLVMHPMHRGFRPTANGCYFHNVTDPSRRTCVSFSAPLMRAEGTITWRGRTLPVTGRGYHDHPWGTEPLFTTHRRWNWGRLSSDQLGAMFADVTPMPGFTGRLRFLYSAEFGAFEPHITDQLQIQPSRFKRDAFFGIRFPHELVAGGQGHPWTMRCLGSLLDTPMYNRSSVQWQRGSASGKGWVECYDLPPILRPAVAIGSRVAAFFWRPFPYFGQ